MRGRLQIKLQVLFLVSNVRLLCSTVSSLFSAIVEAGLKSTGFCLLARTQRDRGADCKLLMGLVAGARFELATFGL
jgi:hypothetical protein